MNFKGFKKVGEDEHKAHFENKNGHVITIAKKGLSQKHLKQLGELPLHAAEGAIVPAKKEDEEIMSSYAGQEPQFLKDFRAAGPSSSYEGERLKQEETGKARSQAINQDVYDALGGSGGWRRAGQKKEEPAPQLAEMPMTRPSDAPTLAPEPAQQEPVAPTAQAPAQQAPSRQVSAQAQPPIDYTQTPEYQKAAADYTAKKVPEWAQEDINWTRDLQNGHITPQTYGSLFAKQDTLGKIGTLFGLMLSGVGSGLSKQPNLVMQMMDNEIKNDLEAQVKSKDNAMNYFRAQQQASLQRAQTGQAQSETALNWQTAAINKMRIAAWQKMQSQVNKLPNGPQKMQGQQMVDGLGAAVQEKNLQDNIALADQEFAAQQKGLMELEGYGDQGAGALRRARDERYVYGFGETKGPVPDDVKRKLISKKEFDRAAREYLAFAEKAQMNWANLNPQQRLDIEKRGAVLGMELQGKYRQRTDGGVYKEGEQDFIKKAVPDTAVSWAARFNQIPKIRQLIENNEMEIEGLAGGYGVPYEKQQNPWQQGEIKTYKGKKYRKGPNGESIEVK